LETLRSIFPKVDTSGSKEEFMDVPELMQYEAMAIPMYLDANSNNGNYKNQGLVSGVGL